jgi:hypothetical protein
MPFPRPGFGFDMMVTSPIERLKGTSSPRQSTDFRIDTPYLPFRRIFLREIDDGSSAKVSIYPSGHRGRV